MTRRSATRKTRPAAPAARPSLLAVEPAAIGAAAAAVYAVVAMGWRAWHGDGVLQPDLVVAAVTTVWALFVRAKVTPLAKPRNAQGQPLKVARPVAGR